MKKTDFKRLAFAFIALAASIILGLKWEKLLVVNPNGERDIQYADSDYSDEEETEEDDEEEYDEEENAPQSNAAPKPKLQITFKKFQTPGMQNRRLNQQNTIRTDFAERKRNYKPESGTAQKIYQDETYLHAQYKITNFRKHILNLSYSMPKDAYRSLIKNYGYRTEELDKLQSEHKVKREKVWEENITISKEAALKAIKIADGDYDMKIRALLYKRGLALKAETKTIEPDIPHIVKMNKDLMKPVALQINKVFKERNYSYEDVIGSVLSFVQTAIIYKQPPLVETNGIHIAGVFPPFRTMLTGWGDCDTKSALAAALLGNWPNIKMVGISVPHHYLMAIRKMPAQGDIFIRYKGSEYVLLEPAGPAWLPIGTVAESTKRLIARQENYKIEPILQ